MQKTQMTGAYELSTGEHNRSVDAGFFEPASFGDRIWLDTDADGIQDGGEVDFTDTNVTITLLDDSNNTVTDVNGTLVAQITTDTGLYSFTNLIPGSYHVKFTFPAGYAVTLLNTGASDTDSDVKLDSNTTEPIVLSSGENNISIDAGLYMPATIGNRIWLDTNADGTQDLGELDFTDDNVTVTLHDVTTGTTVGTIITDTGRYEFTGLIPDEYYVEFTLPGGHILSPSSSVDGDDNDSDVNVSMRTMTTTLVSDENDTTWDMGIYRVTSIGDRVWLDANANGIQDAGELNVTGVIVGLRDDDNNSVSDKDGNPVADINTSATNGAYLFSNLDPGSYHIEFTLPDGYFVSPQDVTAYGTDDTNDSDANVTEIAPNKYITESTILTSNEYDPTWDIGVFVPASMGDRIWLDANADGIQNNAESNYTGSVTVELLDDANSSVTDASGNPVGSISTSTGAYSFDNLIPGSYHVKFTFPVDTHVSPLNTATATATTDSDVRLESNTTIDTVLVSGENDVSWDAGVYMLSSLGDKVWIDTNGNGIQDDSEILDINVTVILHNDTNSSIAGTKIIEMGSNGEYLFDDIVPADYHVEFQLPVGSGYRFIAPDSGSDDTNDSDVATGTGLTPTETILSGESNLTLDAGIYIPVSIGDRVWLDANANGIQDIVESNVSDLNVTLFDENNISMGTVQTDENGSYLFSGLVPGDYHIEFSLIDNNGTVYVASPQSITTGADDTNDSDINATGVTRVESLVSGEQNRDYDAGLYIPVSIGDFVWSDSDGDGIQDIGEMGLSDVNVTLLRTEDNGTITTIGSQDTNSSGGYLFVGLVPGYYAVHFGQPDHYRVTATDSTDDTNDSDINAAGATETFELRSPDDNLSIDAGFYELATVSGGVTQDTNNDDIGDINLSGVVITLVDSTGADVDTTTTDINGSYIFIDVEPGEYTVVETQPANLVSVSEDEGGADDDAGNTTLDNIISVIVGIGEIDIDNDFVEEVGVTIGDRVWMDMNGDGIQDSSETNTTVLDGIQVDLLRDGAVVATTDTNATGYYLFDNYPEGNYSVMFAIPTHYGVSKQNQGSDDTNDSDVNMTGAAGYDYLIPGEDNRTFDMGIYLLGTISGSVLEDINDDDIGDKPMEGVTIILYDEDGNEVARTLTGADGTYSFTDLPQGIYTIKQEQPDGYLDVGETDGDRPDDGTLNSITIDLDAGEHDSDNDYIEEIGGSIGDFVWNDTDGDGIQDANETGVPHVVICLEDDMGNPVLDANSTQRCTETNTTGYYLFEGILPGEYVVVFTLPNNSTTTPYPQEGDDDSIDSDPLEDIGGFARTPVTMGLGDDILTVDMGIVYEGTASLGDYVWHDTNQNGIQDPDEPGLDDVRVILYDADGVKIGERTTYNGGYYTFVGLNAGHYTLEFILPLDWGFTSADTDPNGDTYDSDVNAAGRTMEIDLLEGQHQTVWDAGFFCTCEDIANPSDSGDSLNIYSLYVIILLTGLFGLIFVRREELIRVEKKRV